MVRHPPKLSFVAIPRVMCCGFSGPTQGAPGCFALRADGSFGSPSESGTERLFPGFWAEGFPAARAQRDPPPGWNRPAL